jgi:hypothetical protein
MKGTDLLDTYVRQKGKIFPFGAVRIYANSEFDDEEDDYGGLWLWSKNLLPFADGKHYAQMANNGLLIFNSGTKKKVKTIPFKALRGVEVEVYFVSVYGYLDDLGDYGMEFDKPMSGKRYFQKVKKAADGIRPNSFDNSHFIQVSIRFEGQKVVAISPDTIVTNPSKKDFKIFTLKGEQIEDFEVSYPLSYKQWGVEPEPRESLPIGMTGISYTDLLMGGCY